MDKYYPHYIIAQKVAIFKISLVVALTRDNILVFPVDLGKA